MYGWRCGFNPRLHPLATGVICDTLGLSHFPPPVGPTFFQYQNCDGWVPIGGELDASEKLGELLHVDRGKIRGAQLPTISHMKGLVHPITLDLCAVKQNRERAFFFRPLR